MFPYIVAFDQKFYKRKLRKKDWQVGKTGKKEGRLSWWMDRWKLDFTAPTTGLCFWKSYQKREDQSKEIHFELLSFNYLTLGFSTFTTEKALREHLHNVDDNRVWKLEEGTPVPEEFRVKSNNKGHVQILPNESVTTDKFKEVFITIQIVL